MGGGERAGVEEGHCRGVDLARAPPGIEKTPPRRDRRFGVFRGTQVGPEEPPALLTEALLERAEQQGIQMLAAATVAEADHRREGDRAGDDVGQLPVLEWDVEQAVLRRQLRLGRVRTGL